MKPIVLCVLMLVAFEMVIYTNAQGSSVAIAVYLERFKEKKRRLLEQQAVRRLEKKIGIRRPRQLHGRLSQVLCEDGLQPCFGNSF